MATRIFREKSMERLSSPEQLNDYLRVTSPGIWAMLAAIILLLASLFVWSAFTSIESFAMGSATARGGVLTVSFDDAQTAQRVETGMTVSIGDIRATVSLIGTDENGRIVAGASANIPDGTYEAKVGYKQTRIIRILFN